MIVSLAAGSSADVAMGTANSEPLWEKPHFFAAAVQVMDFYLDPKHEQEYRDIIHLIKKTDEDSVELLRGYVREGMREF